MVTTKRISTGNGWRYMVNGKFASKAQYDRARKKKSSKSSGRKRRSRRSTTKKKKTRSKKTMSTSIPVVGVPVALAAIDQMFARPDNGKGPLADLLRGDFAGAGNTAGASLQSGPKALAGNAVKAGAMIGGYALAKRALGHPRFNVGPLALRF